MKHWARLEARHEAICKLVEQARHESGTQDNEMTVEVIVDYGITGRFIIKNNQDEVVYIMS